MTVGEQFWVLDWSEDDDFDSPGRHAVLGVFDSPGHATNAAAERWPNLVWAHTQKVALNDDGTRDHGNFVDDPNSFDTYIPCTGRAPHRRRGATLWVFPMTVNEIDLTGV